MSLFELMRQMSNCNRASNALYRKVSRDNRLNGRVIFEPNNEEIFTFRLSFVSNERYGLSISFPFDVYANRQAQPSTIETALLFIPEGSNVSSNSSGLCYNDSAGYYDVCRFYSDEELIDEIIRLSDFLISPEFQVNQPHHDEDYDHENQDENPDIPDDESDSGDTVVLDVEEDSSERVVYLT